MDNGESRLLDIDLTRQHIHSLSGADAIAAFFARLGYNTDARTAQTVGNLAITADSTIRPIKKIELIADQEALLQVYVFELLRVTIARARAFPNRENDESQTLQSYIVVMHHATPSLRDQFLDRLPIAQPDHNTAGRPLDIAEHGMKSDYASVQSELNSAVYHLFSWMKKEIEIVEGRAEKQINLKLAR